MQCRCRKIIITRKVVNNISDPTMREICQMLMDGTRLFAVRLKLNLPLSVFYMFVDEIKRLLIDAGIQVRGFNS